MIRSVSGKLESPCQTRSGSRPVASFQARHTSCSRLEPGKTMIAACIERPVALARMTVTYAALPRCSSRATQPGAHRRAVARRRRAGGLFLLHGAQNRHRAAEIQDRVDRQRRLHNAHEIEKHAEAAECRRKQLQ